MLQIPETGIEGTVIATIVSPPTRLHNYPAMANVKGTNGGGRTHANRGSTDEDIQRNEVHKGLYKGKPFLHLVG